MFESLLNLSTMGCRSFCGTLPSNLTHKTPASSSPFSTMSSVNRQVENTMLDELIISVSTFFLGRTYHFSSEGLDLISEMRA